jgi:hypothetical protein
VNPYPPNQPPWSPQQKWSPPQQALPPMAPPAPKKKGPPLLLIGCGALALSCVGCIAFVWIFGPSEEELEARRQVEQPQIEAYYEQVAATFPRIPEPSATVTRCPALVRDPSTRTGTLELPTLLYEGLADWARQPAQSTGTTWTWLNSMERENLTDMTSTGVHGVFTDVEENKRLRYLAVVRASVAEAPHVDAQGSEEWTMGMFMGSLFIVDTQTAQVVCQAPFQAESSSTVETGGGVRIGRIGPTVGDTDLEDAIQDDMQQQTVRALRAALGQMSEEIALDTSPEVRL